MKDGNLIFYALRRAERDPQPSGFGFWRSLCVVACAVMGASVILWGYLA